MTEKQERIAAQTIEDLTQSPCPRCKGERFLVSNRVDLKLRSNMALPAAVIVCKRCGFILLHALGYLGFSIKDDGELDGVSQEKNSEI